MVERRIEELRQNFANLSDPCGALACLVEVAPCAIALYDAAGQCVGANAAYRELFGRDPRLHACVARHDRAVADRLRGG